RETARAEGEVTFHGATLRTDTSPRRQQNLLILVDRRGNVTVAFILTVIGEAETVTKEVKVDGFIHPQVVILDGLLDDLQCRLGGLGSSLGLRVIRAGFWLNYSVRLQVGFYSHHHLSTIVVVVEGKVTTILYDHIPGYVDLTPLQLVVALEDESITHPLTVKLNLLETTLPVVVVE